MFWLKNLFANLASNGGFLRIVFLVLMAVLGVIVSPAFIYLWLWFAAGEFIVKKIWIPFYKTMKPISYFAAIFLVFCIIVLFIGVCQGVINVFEVFLWPLVKFWKFLPLSNNESILVCVSLYLTIGIAFVAISLKYKNA